MAKIKKIKLKRTYESYAKEYELLVGMLRCSLRHEPGDKTEQEYMQYCTKRQTQLNRLCIRDTGKPIDETELKAAQPVTATLPEYDE